MNLIDLHQNEIKNLCQKHEVKYLYAFGSVIKNHFSKNSDIDLLVDFNTEDPFTYTDQYFSLKDKLEHIFSRKDDLLEQKAIRNPFLIEEIDRSKVLLYG
jgi:predicted nucleotidyltransferase